MSYAIGKADTLSGQVTWGSVAVAASIALALAPSAFVQCLRQRRFGAATVALGAVLIFGGYSVTAALGAATGGRLVNELEASDHAARRHDATASIAKAELELSRLGDVRSATQIEAAISATYTNTPGLTECRLHDPNWRPSKAHREACKAIASLGIEKAAADRRAELDSIVSNARATLTNTKAGRLGESVGDSAREC